MSVARLRDVRLRDVQEEDLPVLFEQQNLPEANLMAAFPARDRESFFTHWRNKLLPNPEIITQAIVIDDQVVGNILSWKDGDRRIIGYWIGIEHWGKGIATQALALFMNAISERPLYAHVAKHNLGSIRVLTKCGFRLIREGKSFSKPHGHEIEDQVYQLG